MGNDSGRLKMCGDCDDVSVNEILESESEQYDD